MTLASEGAEREAIVKLQHLTHLIRSSSTVPTVQIAIECLSLVRVKWSANMKVANVSTQLWMFGPLAV